MAANEVAGLLSTLAFGAGAIIAGIQKKVATALVAAGGALLALAVAVKAL